MINNKVVILDVSLWQDNDYTPYKIDFSKAWANGADGVILRAGQNLWIDEDYIDYCKNADKAGLPRGAYWFFDSRVSPIPQADVFADAIELSGVPELGVWGDYEENFGGRYGGEANFKAFMDRLKARFPNKIVGVYTGPSYWKDNTTSTGRSYFAKFPLWIANYKVSAPEIPAPWTNYLLWQFTAEGDGHAFGAESNEIDMNYFGGSLEDYKTYFLLGEYEPAPEKEPGDEMKIYKVKSTATPYINLRETADSNGKDIGDVYPNTQFTSDAEAKDSQGRVWLHSNQAGMVGYIASWLCDFVQEVPDVPTGLPDVLYIATKADMSDKVKYVKGA